MNLPFFTLPGRYVPHSAWTDVAVVRRRSSRRGVRPLSLLRRVSLGLAATAGVLFASAGAWVLAGGDRSVLEYPGTWLSMWTSASAAQAGSAADDGPAALSVMSQPTGARLLVDGRDRGKTPLVVHVTPGPHVVIVTHPDTLDELRQIDVGDAGATLDVSLWRRHPDVVRLRPPYPGASIADAVFLADGRVALSVALPARPTQSGTLALREAWLLDAATGQLDRFDAGTSGSPRAAVLAVSPDGRRVGYLQQSPLPQAGAAVQAATRGALPIAVPGRLDEVWVASAGDAAPLARVFSLPPVLQGSSAGPMDVERLVDLTWTPDSRRLLVATRLGDGAGGGPVRARLLVVDAEPPGQGIAYPPALELVTLPAEVVPGSYCWGPDGRWVAFLTRASAAPGGRNLLSLSAADVGADSTLAGFRYLADLGRADSTGSANLPIAPVAWEPATGSASGRLLYTAPVAAPATGGSGPLGFLAASTGPAEPPLGLFLTNPDAPALAPDERQQLGSATGVLAPVWRQTTSGSAGMPLLGLVRSEQDAKPLVGRLIDPASGRLQDIGLRLPADVAPGRPMVAARWDVAHGRALIVSRPPGTSQASPAQSGALDVWLVQFAPAGGGAGA